MIVATVSFFSIWFAITWFILLRLQLCGYRKSDSERLSEFIFSMTPISFCLGTAACSPSFFMGYGFLFSLHILGANSVLFLAILSSVFFYPMRRKAPAFRHGDIRCVRRICVSI